MPKGPKGERRPGNVVGAAVKVAKIATGEIEEELPSSRSAGGKAGGKARAKKLTPQERQKIAKRAASARWSKRHNPSEENDTT